MSNPSEVDGESANRLNDATTRRPLLAPEVVPVDLAAEPVQSGEELPFAPGGEPLVPETDRENSLIGLATAFRWRRPLLFVLAAAVAVSVALAARRNAPTQSESRASGEMSASTADGAPSGPSTGAGATSSDGSDAGNDRTDGDGSDGNGSDGDDTRIASETVDSSEPQAVPLQVTASSSSHTTTSDTGSARVGGSAAAGTGLPSSTTAARSAAAASSATTATSPTTAQSVASSETITTTERTTTTAPATTERTTTTRATTTQPPTTQRTTTTQVLVGRSAGGFESPSIRRDMVWLDNGDVDRWRSTNGDIQLMRSGFEGITSIDGGQYAELNSSSQAGLYRDLTVAPGTTVEWEFLHRARSGTERIEIRIGPRSSEQVVDTVQAGTQWVTQTGRWRVPSGVTSVRFTLWSTRSGPYGNLVDAIRVVATES